MTLAKARVLHIGLIALTVRAALLRISLDPRWRRK